MNAKCQVFTPNNYVKKLLDSVGYTRNLYGKKILQNSCGGGNILLVIVDRYIDDARNHGVSEEEICVGLATDIYGIEINSETYKQCLNRLDKLAEDKGLKNVRWNIYNEDYLRWENSETFDFIVGNPPYITYQELDKQERSFVREKFDSCKKGKFDYCYAFIEKSIKSLAENGKMSYLIPSSIFKTVHGTTLRTLIKPYLRAIFDYTQEKMFENVLVKSAILLLEKSDVDHKSFDYCPSNEDKMIMQLSELTEKWIFVSNKIKGEKRFGDYFQVSHAVATLLNEAFVLKEGTYKETDTFYLCNDIEIEKNVVKDAVSPRSLRYNKSEKIIFPYNYDNGFLDRYTNEQFICRYPGAVAYLDQYRMSDEKASWFEYGRSQALSGLHKPKLLISTVITGSASVFLLDADCVPYSGMYIVLKEENKEYSLEDAKKLLESKSFENYVADIGIHINGDSLRITSKDIENFTF